MHVCENMSTLLETVRIDGCDLGWPCLQAMSRRPPERPRAHMLALVHDPVPTEWSFLPA